METNYFVILTSSVVIKFGVERKAKVEKPKCCLQNGHIPSFIAQRTFHSLLMCWQHNTVKLESLPFHLKSLAKMRKQLLFIAKGAQQLRDTSIRKSYLHWKLSVLYTFSTQNLVFPSLFQKWNATNQVTKVTEYQSVLSRTKEQFNHTDYHSDADISHFPSWLIF